MKKLLTVTVLVVAAVACSGDIGPSNDQKAISRVPGDTAFDGVVGADDPIGEEAEVPACRTFLSRCSRPFHRCCPGMLCVNCSPPDCSPGTYCFKQ
jgi:hypothetical protein